MYVFSPVRDPMSLTDGGNCETASTCTSLCLQGTTVEFLSGLFQQYNLLCSLQIPPFTCLYYSGDSVCLPVPKLSTYVNTPATGLSLLLMKFSLRSNLHSLANFTGFVGKSVLGE
jgi:hypothetical protein